MSRTFSEGWILIRADLPYSRHSPDALLNEKSASLKGFLKAAVSGTFRITFTSPSTSLTCAVVCQQQHEAQTDVRQCPLRVLPGLAAAVAW